LKIGILQEKTEKMQKDEIEDNEWQFRFVVDGIVISVIR
jgi:hypothetical protein